MTGVHLLMKWLHRDANPSTLGHGWTRHSSLPREQSRAPSWEQRAAFFRRGALILRGFPGSKTVGN